MLRRLDHSTIYLFIAATTTPIALLVLSGPIQIVVLASVWAGAALGIAFALAWIDAPRLLVAGTYLAVGWAGVVAVPQILREVGVAPFVLFLVGGVLYSIGATVYAARRPDPWPTHVRLPRALPHARDRGGDRALHRHGRVGRAVRRRIAGASAPIAAAASPVPGPEASPLRRFSPCPVPPVSACWP